MTETELINRLDAITENYPNCPKMNFRKVLNQPGIAVAEIRKDVMVAFDVTEIEGLTLWESIEFVMNRIDNTLSQGVDQCST